jgi:rod shape-determining protein MreC
VLRRERERRRRRFLPVLICVFLGVGIGVWHNRQAARGRSDIVTSTVRAVGAPVVGAAEGVGGWFSRQWRWMFRGRALAEENRRLRDENDRLKVDNARLAEADATAQRLRAQLGFTFQIPFKRIPADVIARRLHPHSDDFTIRRGVRDGVRNGSTVVVPDGLVGQVGDAGPTASVVVMITDPRSAVGAMIQRPESRALGVCKGDGSPLLSLQYVAGDADVKPGDKVVSSGLGGNKGLFPKGIPIGTVVSVANDTSGAAKKIAIKPFVAFDRLEEVYVLQ